MGRGAGVDERTPRQPPQEDRALSSRFVAIALVLSTGCILVVSPNRYGDHCRFAGATSSQCGECLAQRCRAEIDAACNDDATIAAVESCADKHDCSAIGSLAPSGGAVSSCLAASCGAVCRTLTGASRTACSEPSLSEGTACKCTGGAGDRLAATNDFICDAKAYPDTVCCAPAVGWPSEGQTCTCAPLACTSTPDGCSCGVTTIAPSNPTCSGGACCRDQDKCSCRTSRGCYDSEVPVERCDVVHIFCAKGQTIVPSCSLRSPP